MNKLCNKKNFLKKKLKIIRVTTKPEALLILLKNQLKFINNFHDVIGISSPGKELNTVKIKEGIRVIPLEMTRKITPFKDIWSLLSMIKILKKEKPDVVHSHTPKAGTISMLASIICGVPNRIHTVAGLPLIEKTGMKKKLLFFIEWLTYKCSSKVFVISKNLRKYILKNININPKKLSVIGLGSSNGVDTKYYKKNNKIKILTTSLQNKYNLINKFIFIFVGRVVKDKGVDELFEAFIKLNSKFTDTRLLIVGRQENDLNPISNKSKEILRLNKNIINVGYKNDIRPYLNAAHCLVLPSYREGFPQVILQAGCMEIPSIVSNIHGCNEIIKNKINGLLIQPKNTKSLYLAMKKIFSDKKLYIFLKNSSRKNISKKFSQAKFLYDLLNIYSNLKKKVK